MTDYEEEKKNPSLIIDSSGEVGAYLARELLKNGPCVFVTEDEEFSFPLKSSRLHVVRLGKKIPRIPAYRYKRIFVVYQGEKVIEKYLSQIVEKAKEDKAKPVFLIAKEYASDVFVSRLMSLYPYVSCVIFKDIISGNDEFEGRAEELLFQAKVEKKVVLLDDGLLPVEPMFISTLVKKAIDVSSESFSNIYFAFPKHPLTELSFCRILLSINPDIGMQFTKKKSKNSSLKKQDIILPRKGEYMRLEREDFVKILTEEKLLEGKKSVKKKTEKREKKLTTPKRLTAVFLVFLLSLVCLPFLVSLLSFVAGGFLLFSGFSYFEKGDFDRSYKSAYSAKNSFSFSESIVSDPRLSLLFFHVPMSSTFSSAEDGAQVLMHASKALKQLKNVFEGKTSYPKDEFVSAVSELKNVLLLVQQLPEEVFISAPFLDKKEVSKLSRGPWATAAQKYTPLLEVMPNIFGIDGKKKYLVLFQNNMELRPSGGFIGSYGLLSLKNGKTSDFTIQNVYDADGQLKGHVEPPYPIRRYLPQVHWYLRDSNFSPDFPTTASVSAYFLREETGEEVDGVIGVDLSFVKNILKAVGPVYLTEYRKEITAENMYEMVQKESQENSFAGSNQKKDILKSLFDGIVLKLEDKKNVSLSSLAKALLSSIDQKHVVFVFSDTAIENAFLVSGLSSSFWDGRQKKENTILDFLSVSEANLGVNKANYFVTRSISHKATFAQNTAGVGEVTIHLKHSGEKGDSKNDYKTYLRIYTPEGTTISDIFLQGERVTLAPAVTDPKLYEAKGFRPPSGLEVEIGKELQKTAFGFPVIVASGTDMKIVVTYKLPFRVLTSEKKALYSLLFVKQAGTEPYPFSFTGEFPGFAAQNNRYNEELTKDIVIDVPLVKE